MNEKNSVKKHSKIMMLHSNLFHCLKMSSVVYTDEILILSTEVFQFVHRFGALIKTMKRGENSIDLRFCTVFILSDRKIFSSQYKYG